MKKYIILINILVFSLYMYGCKGEFFGPGMADFSINSQEVISYLMQVQLRYCGAIIAEVL
jgi:hypothetical protein